MDNVVRQVPHAAPESFLPSARPAHNISPLGPAFNPERLQKQCHPMMDEDEVTSNLRFPEIRCSQRAPFVTNSSRLMERIPSMRQQREAGDDGVGRGIYFEQTMQMEPNTMLLAPDPYEAESRHWS
ncbi:hypothetical protein P3L10_014201 [Capsicum annuum]|uniref:uncharacterized protein LOC107854113 n=1 Tax=Capsicum annuum TaxID=4072 RepID=UPI001FB17D03|nr:uncharacterized protein LOC107854113 [Capsicum annuum]